jgi:hypothetical protein
MYKLCLEPLDPRDPFFFFYIIQQNFTGGARGMAITLHFCVQMFTMGGSKWHNTERDRAKSVMVLPIPVPSRKLSGPFLSILVDSYP